LLANGWWFSPASSTTKTGRHEIAEILLKVNKDTISRKMKDRKIPKENEQKDKHELRNITQFKMNLTKNRG
jgi:hypothetical protein